MLLKEEGSTYLVRKGADGECRVSYKQLHQVNIKILRIRNKSKFKVGSSQRRIKSPLLTKT